jgi:hypothetical protein
MALLGKKKQAPLFKKKPEYKQKDKKPSMKLKAAAILIIVVAAIALYAFFVLQVNQTVVSSPTIINITQQGGVYSINSNQYFISLSKVSLTNDNVYITINKLPVFINPLLNISLTLNNITKINVGTNYSNIGIQLLSISPTSAEIKVSPLFPSLQIAPDSGKISTIRTTLSNSTAGAQQSGSTAVQTTQTTTISATTATTTAATTTIAANETAQKISTALKHSNVYGLMLNFSIMYSNTTKCTPPIYNTSYVKQFGHLPNGPNSYANITSYVPYNLSSNITYSGNGNYNMVYRTKTANQFFNNVVALRMNINVSSQTVTSTNFTGAFEGLNYQQLAVNYATAQNIGGPCAISIP